MVAQTCPISVRKSTVLSSFVPSPRRGRGAPGAFHLLPVRETCPDQIFAAVPSRLSPSPVRFGWERVGVRAAFRVPSRSRPVPVGGSTTLVGQLPIETKCPDPPVRLCPVSGCRGSFFPLVKKDPHHRRESIFRSRRGSRPHRIDSGRPRLRTRQWGRQSATRSAGRALRISLASQHDAYLQPTAKSGRLRARVSMAV
jgi:hypothetical protein